MKLFTPFAVALSMLVTSLGCESPSLPSAAESTTAGESSTPPPAEPEQPMVAGAPGKELPETEEPVTDIPRKFIASDPVQGRRSRREASEGSNVLGIGSAAAAGFYAKHQSFILAIDQANQLYWGRNNLEWAKTQEEFMREVVELALNGQKLPELQEDHEYCYVPSQPETGLQIRLKPGSPKSKVPAGTTPEDAIKLLTEGSQAAGGAGPTGGAGETSAATTPPEPESGRDAAGNPLDLRERAAGIGGPALDIE